jgi:hypothetical protein
MRTKDRTMLQATLAFDARHAPQHGRGPAPSQARLPFKTFVQSGSRGVMPDWWVGRVLDRLAADKLATPSVCGLQSAWDAGYHADHPGLAEYLGAQPEPRRVYMAIEQPQHEPLEAQRRLSLPDHTPKLALPSPIRWILSSISRHIDTIPVNPRCQALNMLAEGMSQRATAKALGIPISTLRDRLGFNVAKQSR